MDSSTEVLVIGGGSTGTGVARDLAMRGVGVTLVEKGNLTHGTTGRMHGLLHSGGRYAVSDEASARDCIVENRILREIASHCVEFTGGLFAQRPEDGDEYFERKLEGCRECGIPTEVRSGEEARDLEPYLSEDVERAIWVPDGAIDPFRLCVANAESAVAHGARIETHAEVTDLLVDDPAAAGRQVLGAEIRHETGTGPREHGGSAETETIRADHVVNATGAWAGQIGALADVEVAVQPSKGAMTVTNVRQVDTVVNRCRPKGDADIVVPHEATAILGTTDVAVEDPEDYPEDGWEVDLLIDELSELVPILAEARTLRSFWGVRPLYEPPGAGASTADEEGGQDTGSTDPTDITRDFFLLDHAERDGVEGFTSIVGGKFTTYRAMAEEISDYVCDELGVSAPCRTADVALPGSEEPARLDEAMDRYGLRSPIARRSAERLGSRTEDVLTSVDPNPVVCDCEAVTRAEIQNAIEGGAGSDLNSVRIRTRASMGNCQGGFCCQAMANELSPAYDEPTVRAALDELIAERWKGERHALWGEQLAQAALNYAQFATTANRDRDPADEAPPDYDAFDAGPAVADASGSDDAVADGRGRRRSERAARGRTARHESVADPEVSDGDRD